MNFNLTYLPKRSEKPRNNGLTMMMDKGLSIRQVEDFIETSSEYTDIVKFGFGTSAVTTNLKEKINLYKSAGIRPYFGGTLFEVFAVRKKFNQYRKLIDEYDLDLAEVSDGSIAIPHDLKCDFIRNLSSQIRISFNLFEFNSDEKNI